MIYVRFTRETIKVEDKEYYKDEVLVVLYNNSITVGLGMLHHDPTDTMTLETAQVLIQKQSYFDYLGGRVLKLNFDNEVLDTWLYNRDNGEGVAEKLISQLKSV